MVDVSLWTTTSHLVPRLHEAIPPSELLPHKLVQSDDSWMPSDGRRICSAVNYSARSIFTSLREVWKPLASPLSAAPAVSHHQSLVSRAGLLSDRLQRALGQSLSNIEPEICSGKKPSAIQLVSQGAWVAFYPNFDWSLGPVTICPLISHLFKHNHRPTKQLQFSPQCHSLASTMKKLTDSDRSFKYLSGFLKKFFLTLFISSLFHVLLGDSCAAVMAIAKV